MCARALGDNDKDNRAKTKQFNDFNDGHVVDIAEIAAGDDGEDVCNEFKCFSTCKKSRTSGQRGAPASVGHILVLTSTASATPRNTVPPRQSRLQSSRGRAADGPFDHKTGKGHMNGR